MPSLGSLLVHLFTIYSENSYLLQFSGFHFCLLNFDAQIRISEMLLGKVPDGFSFTPKQKSNAYDSAQNG